MNPKIPWSFPVPVKKGPFIGPNSFYDEFNVVTDLSVLNDPFPSRSLAANDLLYSDSQLAFPGTPHRWGAGRSGHFRGHYLKGLGLTPLAANWNSEDFFHSSGHLPAISGAWELLISELLKKLGLADRICRCEALLVAPTSESYRAALHADARNTQGHRLTEAPANLWLRSLSIKPGEFARPSNFLWLMAHSMFEEPDHSEYSAMNFFRLLSYFCFQTKDVTSVDLEKLVTDLESCFLNTLKSMTMFYSVGLDWANYHNNFSLDGRFIDLETPIFIGSPLFGWVKDSETRTTGTNFRHDLLFRGGSAFGLTSIHSFMQWQHFIRELTQRCHSLSQFYQSIAQNKLAEIFAFFSQALSKKFSAEHLLFNQEKIAQWLSELISEGIDLNSVTEARLRDLTINFLRSKYQGQAPGDQLRLDTEDLGQLNYAMRGACTVLRFKDYPLKNGFVIQESARLLSQQISELEALVTCEAFLDRLAMAQAEIKSQ